MSVLLVNNAVSTLAASLAADALVLSVNAGDGGKFPAPTGTDWFPLTLVRADGVREIVRCTARTGDVLTVTRAQEGTAAVPFASGDRAEVRLTAGALNYLFGGATATPTFGGLELVAATPYVDFHAGSSADDYTSRIIAQVAGELSIRSAAKEQARIDDSGLTVLGSVGATGGATFNGAVVRIGAEAISFHAYRNDSGANSFFQAQTTAGSVYFGNSDGATFMVAGSPSAAAPWSWVRNGSAAFNGSVSMGMLVSNANAAISGDVNAANFIAAGAMYTGGGAAYLSGNGQVSGSLWGGLLSTYLVNTYTQRGNIGGDIASFAGGTGGIGTYGLMTNRSGVPLSPGQLVGGAALTYANTEDSVRNGGAATGTWRCMGVAAASASDQGTTLFLRIA